jgi:hypothetical protein
MRLSAWLWPFPFGVRLGWATTRTPNPALEDAAGRAYLLRGNAVVWSRGFGRICDRLRTAGWWAEDLRPVGDLWVRRQLIADSKAGRLHGPVILVGHSCGGRYATYSAQRLASFGIRIDLIICVDVAGPFDVPANVTTAVHLYRSRRRLYPARPLRPVQGSPAQIMNIDLDAADSPISPTGLNHLNITWSPAVQDWIVARVLETVSAGR